MALDVPSESQKTLYEDRCCLFHKDNGFDAATAAKFVPVLGLSTSPPAEVVTQNACVYPPEPGITSSSGGEDAGLASSSLAERIGSHLHAATQPITRPLGMLWTWLMGGSSGRATALPTDWHPRQPWLAAADASGQVHILDLGQTAPFGSAGPAGATGGTPLNGTRRCEVLQGAARVVLSHALHGKQVHALAWCPTSPGLLAVGVTGGVCLWSVAGEARPPLAGRSGGPWLRFLRLRSPHASAASLSWSPDGRLLAAAAPGLPGLTIWDAATGAATPASAGPAAFSLVRWSPCGNYVFAAPGAAPCFHVFETQRWRAARWAAAGRVVAATWAPSVSSVPSSGTNGRGGVSGYGGLSEDSLGQRPVVLVALAGQSHLVALHLVDAPPGLTAQVLPVGLPELGVAKAVPTGPEAPIDVPRMPPRMATSAAARAAAAAAAASSTSASGSLNLSGASSSSVAAAVHDVIADLAWDARGERLAVLLKAPHPAAGCVALYATSPVDAVVTPRLLGFARAPAAAAATAISPAAGGAAAAKGAGAGALPGSLAMMAAPPAAAAGLGGLMSLRCGPAHVFNLAMYF